MRKSDAVFFLTGAAALVYETVWARLLARLLGSDAAGLAVVLAIFMGGMALGAAVAGPLAGRLRHPVGAFAALEAGLGLWAAASPWLIARVDAAGAPSARIVLAALVLLPPTAAMGATFPLMGRLTIADDARTREETSAFYGANTVGAALGALLGPMAFMPAFGLRGALIAAGAIDLVAAGLALRLLRAPHRDAPHAPVHVPPTDGALRFDRVLAVACLLGAASLALEVLLSRILVTLTGASIHAIAIVLSVFLLGIGLGSRYAMRAPAAAGPRALFLSALAVPVLSFAGLLALRWQIGEPDLFASLSNRMPVGAGIPRLWASHALLAALALLPPAIAFGIALPSAVADLAGRRGAMSRERVLGRVYLVNTAGALAGSLGAGFVLLPRLGPRVAVGVALALCLVAAWLAPGRRAVPWLAGLAPSVVLGAWVLMPRIVEGRTVLFHAFDAQASASVEETREPTSDGAAPRRVRTLRVSGKPVASTAPVDLRLQRLLGHVPGLLHGEVRTALVIGLGTGMTAGSLLDLPSLESVRVCEISPAVGTAARSFGDWNGHLLDDPRTELVIADGRHALAREVQSYDLVTSDPIHPWTLGSSDLYSLEHFRTMARRLGPAGVASQWLPLYELSTADVKTIVATWCAAFPHTSAWLSAYDLVLIGSLEPLPGPSAIAAMEIPPPVLRSLAETGIHSAAEIAALCVADDAALRGFAAGAVAMVDDRPVLEFRAPLAYLSGYSTEVLAWAARDEFVERLPAACRPRALEVRVLVRRFLERLPAGLSRAARLYGEELLRLEPVRG